LTRLQKKFERSAAAFIKFGGKSIVALVNLVIYGAAAFFESLSRALDGAVTLVEKLSKQKAPARTEAVMVWNRHESGR